MPWHCFAGACSDSNAHRRRSKYRTLHTRTQNIYTFFGARKNANMQENSRNHPDATHYYALAHYAVIYLFINANVLRKWIRFFSSSSSYSFSASRWMATHWLNYYNVFIFEALVCAVCVPEHERARANPLSTRTLHVWVCLSVGVAVLMLLFHLFTLLLCLQCQRWEREIRDLWRCASVVVQHFCQCVYF